MNVPSLTVSVPGKLLLLGDHAVVYGQPCLVTAINQTMQVSITGSNTNGIEKITPDTQNTSFLDAAISYASHIWKLPDSYLIETKSSFSGKYGFGSSSAVTVGVLKILSELAGVSLSKKELFQHSYNVVLSVQKTGSGFDVAAAVYGGTILYQKGEIIETVPHPSYELIVGYSGVKGNTVTLIQEVAAKRNQYPEKMDKIFSAIGQLVIQARDNMIEGDYERVGTLMNFNQEYLRDIGVSTEKLETLISAAKAAGAWGAKLSGAGGGDCMIAIVSHEKSESVKNAIQSAGGEVINVLTDEPGVHFQTTDNQDEMFIVVDTEDTVLGYKTRYECHHNPELIHRAVGMLLFDDHNRVLLQKRSMTKDTRPGYWSSSVGGHVEKGETYDDAIQREMKEELGIDTPVKKIGTYIQRYPNESEMQTLYIANYSGNVTVNNQEIEEVRFFSSDELKHLIEQKQILLAESGIYDLQHIKFI